MNCYRCDTPLPDSSRYCYSCGADVSGDSGAGAQPVERDPELEAKLAAELEGEFVIERLIGRGGMAVVFLARDLHLNRKVAIKVLPPELTYGPGLVERFKREARTAATLDHSHIVPIYRISSSGKIVWFAMKYVEGETLATVLEREKTLPPDRVAGILTRVAEALEFAHQHGVIHRDVKPANVMLDRRGWVTVTDFGIAKAVDTQSLTGSGAILGTPFYMSPEQCSGKRTITGATDQYSLGVMAYQMLSGRLPFVGQSTVDIIKQQCFDTPPPLGALQPNLSSGLVAVVERALAKEPERRFPSVAEFARAFASSAAHGEPATLRLQPFARAPARRSRHRAMLGALGAVAAVAAVGLLLWPQGKVKPEAGFLQARPDSVVVIQILGAPSSLEEGEQVGLKATAKNVEGRTVDSATLVWSSSDTAIALVERDGSVTGTGRGTAIITALSGGQSASVGITVKSAPVASLQVARPPGPMQVGGNVELTAVARDSRGRHLRERRIEWSSRDPAVATVSETGSVTGVAPGTVMIDASSEGIRDSVPILVAPLAVASLQVEPRDTTLLINDSLRLNAVARDARGKLHSARAVEWTSNNPSVAVVAPSGTVTAKAPGTASIMATTEGARSLPTTITVARPAGSSLQVRILPSWADVSIDGRNLGHRARLEGTFEAGVQHALHFERDGYVTFDTTVTLQPGKQLQLTITMKRRSP